MASLEVVRQDEWKIRLQCMVCGQRKRRHRADGNPPFGNEPQATIMVVCDQCNADAGYPVPEVRTKHFVDYATDAGS